MKKSQNDSRGIGKKFLSLALSGVMAFSMVPAAAPALTAEASAIERPFIPKAGSIPASEENVTEHEPFTPLTWSTNFRIPVLLNLQDGSLMAGADARYETSSDGGGLDSVVSVSSDGGNTWNYSLPFYFPDSNGYAGTSATTIIDPGAVEGPDGTIYFIADVNPTGSTTLFGEVPKGTGYVTVNGKRYLALTDKYSNVRTMPTDENTDVWPYYIDDPDEEGYSLVRKRIDGSETGYAVDEWRNLYSVENGQIVDNLRQNQVNDKNTQVQQSVFYKDSALHVYHIDYLWVVESKDHGKTWENPRDITDQVKRYGQQGLADDNAILISPGRGISTRSGDIVIGCYDHANSGEEENASIIYSTDNGATWKRTGDVQRSADGGMWSSENEIVELEDGTLRMFYRSGAGTVCYSDAKKVGDEYVMDKECVNTGVSCYSRCNVSAISYSKKINGKQAVLVATPSGSSRANGKIFTFLVNDDNTMDLFAAFAVPGSATGFAYSCLSETESGEVALLWEPNAAGTQKINFNKYSILEVAPGANVENVSVTVRLDKGDSYSRAYTQEKEPVITTQPDAAVAQIETGEQSSTTVYAEYHDHVANNESDMTSFSAKASRTEPLSNAEFTFTKTAENKYKIYNEATGTYLENKNIDSFFTGTAAEMLVQPTQGKDGTTFRICQGAGTRYIFFYYKEMDMNANTNYAEGATNGSYELTLWEKKDTVSPTDVIAGYERASSITDGKKYLISYVWTDGSVILLYPANGKVNQTKLLGNVEDKTESFCTVSITGTGVGYTTAVVDGVRYRISISESFETNPDPDCKHEQYTVVGAIPADCEEEGYTGDKVCNACGHVTAGEISKPTGHDWDDGVITKEVTADSDGEMVYTCKNDELHKKTVLLYAADYAKLKEQVDFAASLQESSDLMGAGLKAELKEWKQKAESIQANGAIRMEIYKNLEQLSAKTLEAANEVVEGTLKEAEAYYAAGKPDGVTDEQWQNFEQAYKALGAADAASIKELMSCRAAFTEAKNTVTEANDLLKAKAALQQAVANAKNLIDAGGSAYTEDSWRAFETAYYHASSVPANATSAQVKALTKVLADALAKLALKPAVSDPAPKPGDVKDDGTYSYKILSTTAKTVELKGLKKTSLKKIKINDTVKLSGTSYKVVSVAASAFKGNKKIASVTGGKYVTKIGANAFAGCTKLKSVTIQGKSLKSIGSKAFSGDKALKKITLKTTALKTVGKNAFKGINKKAVIQVTKKKLKAYKKVLAKKGQSKTVKIK